MGQTDSHGCSKRQLRRLLIHSRLRPHRLGFIALANGWLGITQVPLGFADCSFRHSSKDVISRCPVISAEQPGLRSNVSIVTIE